MYKKTGKYSVCPKCGQSSAVKFGKTSVGAQRYRCQNTNCQMRVFQLKYTYAAYEYRPVTPQRVLGARPLVI